GCNHERFSGGVTRGAEGGGRPPGGRGARRRGGVGGTSGAGETRRLRGAGVPGGPPGQEQSSGLGASAGQGACWGSGAGERARGLGRNEWPMLTRVAIAALRPSTSSGRQISEFLWLPSKSLGPGAGL